VKILAISGSVRARSTNTEVLKAAGLVAPPSVRVELYTDLTTLPHFNPDLDDEGMDSPPAVAELRDAVGAADGLLICTPEYAHGLPGVLKNALDWLVSSPAIVGKPVAILNASPRSTHAVASLAETLRTMSAVLYPPEPVMLADAARRDASDIAADPTLSAILRDVVTALLAG
jgi:chromate reductase, NAD(P)H dehydrogenase (quinone)